MDRKSAIKYHYYIIIIFFSESDDETIGDNCKTSPSPQPVDAVLPENDSFVTKSEKEKAADGDRTLEFTRKRKSNLERPFTVKPQPRNKSSSDALVTSTSHANGSIKSNLPCVAEHPLPHQTLVETQQTLLSSLDDVQPKVSSHNLNWIPRQNRLARERSVDKFTGKHKIQKINEVQHKAERPETRLNRSHSLPCPPNPQRRAPKPRLQVTSNRKYPRMGTRSQSQMPQAKKSAVKSVGTEAQKQTSDMHTRNKFVGGNENNCSTVKPTPTAGVTQGEAKGLIEKANNFQTDSQTAEANPSETCSTDLTSNCNTHQLKSNQTDMLKAASKTHQTVGHSQNGPENVAPATNADRQRDCSKFSSIREDGISDTKKHRPTSATGRPSVKNVSRNYRNQSLSVTRTKKVATNAASQTKRKSVLRQSPPPITASKFSSVVSNQVKHLTTENKQLKAETENNSSTGNQKSQTVVTDSEDDPMENITKRTASGKKFIQTNELHKTPKNSEKVLMSAQATPVSTDNRTFESSSLISGNPDGLRNATENSSHLVPDSTQVTEKPECLKYAYSHYVSLVREKKVVESRKLREQLVMLILFKTTVDQSDIEKAGTKLIHFMRHLDAVLLYHLGTMLFKDTLPNKEQVKWLQRCAWQIEQVAERIATSDQKNMDLLEDQIISIMYSLINDIGRCFAVDSEFRCISRAHCLNYIESVYYFAGNSKAREQTLRDLLRYMNKNLGEQASKYKVSNDLVTLSYFTIILPPMRVERIAFMVRR